MSQESTQALGTTTVEDAPKRSSGIFGPRNRSVLYLFGILAIAVVVMSILDDNFLTVGNIFNVLNQQSTLGIVTMGIAMLMIAGSFDLTVGNLLACVAGVAAILLTADISPAIVVPVACLTGLSFGLLQRRYRHQDAHRLIHRDTRSHVRLSGIGADHSRWQQHLPAGPFRRVRYVQDRRHRPLPVVYFVTVTIIAYLVMRFTKYGRNLYAIGGNPEAAFLAGINIDLHQIIAYSVSGLLAGFTSLIVISRIGQSQPAMGISYPLETIAAAVIGGVALSGGKGTIPGVFLGVILLGLIRNSLNILRVPSFYQYVMLGVVIIVAVTLSNIGTFRKSGSN